MENHNQVFVGMTSGNIHIYQIDENEMAAMVIRFKQLFPSKKSSVVTDIKSNPQMMHRILIAFEEVAVVVYSLNKNRDIQQILFSEYDKDKGKALSVEWLPPDYTKFVVGFSTGLICFYKHEKSNSANLKPYKTIEIQQKQVEN